MRLHRLLKMNWHGTEHRYHMVQKCIRIFLAGMLFFCTAAVSQLAAIPGIDSCLPDIPGAYVYYRDYSFPDTVYIGFLQYDETSYCMRLYSDSLRGSSAPYALEIYFTLGEKDGRTEMTGERIMGSFSPDETDLVNYLHDLVYEFSARRGNISAQTFASSIAESFQSDTQATLKTHFISVQEEYPQFGGTVDMNYAFYIPVFNLHSITAPNGDIRFELITAAALSHSSDTSFFDFTGIPLSISDKERDFTPADNPEILGSMETRRTWSLDAWQRSCTVILIRRWRNSPCRSCRKAISAGTHFAEYASWHAGRLSGFPYSLNTGCKGFFYNREQLLSARRKISFTQF